MSLPNEGARIELRQRLDGSGAFVTDSRRSANVIFELVRDSTDASAMWTLSVSMADADRAGLHGFVASAREGLTFEGHTSSGETILLQRVFWREVKGNRLVADVSEVWIGPMEPIRRGSRVGVEIDLSPTPLARGAKSNLVLHWTGEIRPMPELEPFPSEAGAAEREPPSLSIASLRLRFVRGYRFVDGSDTADGHLLRVAVPMLYGECTGEILEGVPVDVLGRIEPHLEDALRVLSLLSRRDVAWQRISLAIWPPAENPGGAGQVVSVHRSRHIGRSPDEHRMLVNSYRIQDGELDAIVQRHSASPNKDAVNAAIIYMNEARVSQFIESSVVNSFTALEAVCGSVAETRGRHENLASNKFRRLRTHVAAAIREHAAEHEINDEIADAMMSKFAELNRPTLLTNVEALVAELDVQWKDLWLRAASLREGLQPAVQRRNSFIHAGRLNQPHASQLDAMLVCALVERIVFRLLGVPATWIPDHADGHMRDVALAALAYRREA